MKLLLALLILSIFVYQLPCAEQSVKIGFKGGLSVSDQNWWDDLPNHRQDGFAFSLSLDYPVWRNLHLSSEADYVQKGIKGPRLHITTYQYPIGEIGYVQDYRFDYLAIRLAVKQYIVTQHFALYFGAGPELNILLHKNKDAELILEYVYKTDFKRIVFGYYLAAGFTIKMDESKAIIIEANYCKDINDASKDMFSDRALKNRSLQLMTGIQFGFDY